MNENFSDDLKKAIEEGFVILDEKHHFAIVGANAAMPDSAEGILLLLHKRLGLTAELTLRHGYTVL